jgi:hypothetical protein
MPAEPSSQKVTLQADYGPILAAALVKERIHGTIIAKKCHDS